jgi:hypothetical protein
MLYSIRCLKKTVVKIEYSILPTNATLSAVMQSENSKTEFTYSFEVGPHMLFCLSAKRIGENFYISQYRDFPRSCEAYLKKEGKVSGPEDVG